MSAKNTASFGRWPSQLTAQTLANNSLRFGAPKLVGDAIFWPQSLPNEGGRTTLMLKTGNSDPQSLLPKPWDIRSKVHEYGGGAYTVASDAVYFVNAADQQIYSFNGHNGYDDNAQPQAITQCHNARFADLIVHPSGRWLFAICEKFNGTKEPCAQVVAINTHALNTLDNLTVLTEGADFYAGLCVSPCGKKIAFISWNHPNMPWDNTQLWEFDWQEGSAQTAAQLIAGKDHPEAIVQPGYSPNSQLYYVSDKNNWWNIYTAHNPQPLFTIEGECATPQWVFGMQNWGFIDDRTLLFSVTQNGQWQLKTFNLDNQKITHITTPYNAFSYLHCHNGQAVFLAAGALHAQIPALFNGHTVTPLIALTPPLEAEDISQPQSIWFSTTKNQQAHCFFYPPCNKNYQGPANAKPPLIVLGHGGPTAAAEPAFNVKIQYWTNRGFAVADVNYRGSTGFGRHYRNLLLNNWGICDVEDLCNAARFLEAQGLVHPQQKIIKGSSAGGFSVLAALTQQTVFNAGVSFYGIADLHALATDTHKFESHYLDGLIGRYPEANAIYTERSPIHHIEQLNCPLFIAQGLDDKVVPPAQADLIVQAAKNKGLYVDYLTFTGEGHGFRKAETLVELCERELAFYSRIFNLTP